MEIATQAITSALRRTTLNSQAMSSVCWSLSSTAGGVSWGKDRGGRPFRLLEIG
jgi:hypothetical protein